MWKQEKSRETSRKLWSPFLLSPFLSLTSSLASVADKDRRFVTPPPPDRYRNPLYSLPLLFQISPLLPRFPSSFLPLSRNKTMTLSPGPTLTQTDILSLPRPSAPISNPSSTLAIWRISTHSFSSQRTNRQFNLVRLDTNKAGWEGIKDTEVLKEGLDGLEVQWLDDQTICYLSPAKPDSSNHDHLSPASQGEELSDEEWKGVKSEWVREMGGRRETVVWAMDVVTKEEYKLGQFPVAYITLSSHHCIMTQTTKELMRTKMSRAGSRI